jgi:hypothetical protein
MSNVELVNGTDTPRNSTGASPKNGGPSPSRTDFTRELTDLCRRHGIGIEGGHIWEMDTKDTGPDADANAEYAINEDGYLVRTF